ncbi:hypothetical protein HUG17_1682 [Dermatophagoides farinae]|uniref:SH2 domain-containing protein n=1 Tax=Dermatophagoides farinae TaxID=6954 RepID=A0A9D4P9V2_DERFA|nr:hypothetical protein HUG17_1682 [Dermatophagoides farinae]
MLEFFPPNAKSMQPKCGLVCNMLDEVRETKPLEMPERPYTAVLRFSNFIEYIIEFKNAHELFDWVRKIRAQLPQGDTINNDDDDDHKDYSVSNDYLYDMLDAYPWFHRDLSRTESSELVLSGGEQWSGVFLVRQSQTHFGECVLTFNYYGQQAKHFRIIIKGSKGECQIERLCFRSIIDLLQYFRQYPIPLRHQPDHQEKEFVLTSFIIFENKLNKEPNDRNSSFFNRRSFIQLMDNARWLTSPKQSIDTNKNRQISKASVRLTREELPANCL